MSHSQAGGHIMNVVVLRPDWHGNLLLTVPMVLRHGWHMSLLTVLGKASWKGQAWWRFGESSKTLASKTKHQDVVLDESKNKGMCSKVSYRHREFLISQGAKRSLKLMSSSRHASLDERVWGQRRSNLG